jgi:hypothetical protein
LNKQFKVELYFLKKSDEGNYFFDKNQRPTPTAKSKAYDLTSQDDLSVLAKRVIDLTPSLAGNVNRVTDRLTAKNANLVTLSTLRETLKHASDAEGLDESEIEGFAHVASSVLQLLTETRPELGNLPLAERKRVRASTLADAPIIFQAYSALISDFNADVAALGLSKATDRWREKFKKIGPSVRYTDGAWSGDFFQRDNPLWTRLGILKPGASGRPTMSNNRAARIQAMRALRAVVANDTATLDLQALVP